MTTRTDANLAALLRHLGAAYYESLHGQATKEDVNRAVDSVTEHLREQGEQLAEGECAAAPVHPGQPRLAPDQGRA